MPSSRRRASVRWWCKHAGIQNVLKTLSAHLLVAGPRYSWKNKTRVFGRSELDIRTKMASKADDGLMWMFICPPTWSVFGTFPVRSNIFNAWSKASVHIAELIWRWSKHKDLDRRSIVGHSYPKHPKAAFEHLRRYWMSSSLPASFDG